MESAQPVAILFSGGSDSLALFAMAATGNARHVEKAPEIHLVTMQNGMSRFDEFPETRYQVARDILQRRSPVPIPESVRVERDCGRLFQEFWLDRQETLMPKFGGKNLVCVACKLAMHTSVLLYCLEHNVARVLAGYAKKQTHYPEQRPVFMERIAAFSREFGISCAYPVFDAFAETRTTRHYLEDLGLPSTGGGERKCLFCQVETTAEDAHITAYLDAMIPVARDYVNLKRDGRIREAAEVFGRASCMSVS